MLDTHNDAHHLCWFSADNAIGHSFNPITSIGDNAKAHNQAHNQAQQEPCCSFTAPIRRMLRGDFARAAPSFHVMKA